MLTTWVPNQTRQRDVSLSQERKEEQGGPCRFRNTSNTGPQQWHNARKGKGKRWHWLTPPNVQPPPPRDDGSPPHPGGGGAFTK